MAFPGRLPAVLKFMLDDLGDVAGGRAAEVKRPAGFWALYEQAKPTPLLAAG
jgi:hypothetical protein